MVYRRAPSPLTQLAPLPLANQRAGAGSRTTDIRHYEICATHGTELIQVNVSDISLVDYIAIKEKHAKYLPTPLLVTRFRYSAHVSSVIFP